MKLQLVAAAILSTTTLQAQQTDSILLRKLSNEIMLHSTCYENLRDLTKNIGHRLSGSESANKAVHWAVQKLKDAGADTVYLQPVEVPHWVRGKEYLKVQWAGDIYQEIEMLSLGNTEGTSGKELVKPIICVSDLAEFEQLDPALVKDKIVFFNYKFRQDIINTFEGYGDAVIYRWVAVNKAAKKGAAAVIIRSVSTAPDAVAHTGASRYDNDVPHIPAVAIGNTSADRLAEACKQRSVLGALYSECRMIGTAPSFNVIGELKGSDRADEYIVAGGHLDSWDVGEGAHDDGAGCVQAIELIRSFKALAIKPRRTIRAVMYMNEENGVRGGHAYADSALARREQHVFAMESDAGGFVPRGVGLDMPSAHKSLVQSWASLFLPYGVYDFDQEEGGVDIGPLKKQQVPLAGLLPDPQRYFDLHHSRSDVFETVNHRELKLGAWVMAAMVVMADKYFP